ncbi:MAG: S1 RNA-binding domain-containing protein [bacterium]
MGHLKVGQLLTVKVEEAAEHGVFVKIGVSRLGYIPIEEIADGFDGSPRDLFRKDDTLKAMLVAITGGGRRLTLSLKEVGRYSPASDPAVPASKDIESTGPKELTFEQIYKRYQKESHWRLAHLKKNIQNKGGEL